MKKMLILLLAGMTAAAAHAQHADDEAIVKAWQSYMTPGDIHKMLAKSDGRWTTESTVWVNPGSPPSKGSGVCTNKMVLGGRYQESTIKGSVMDKPFEGQSTLAYDNAKKVFLTTWIDNMGTGIINLEGTWDDATKSINFHGRCVDPASGQDMTVREVFTIIDNNHQRMERYVADPKTGKEFKTMELNFTRSAKKK